MQPAFANLLKQNRRGKLKIYLGMCPGVGKTYRMLLEARELLANHIDVKIGYIETHNRPETHALLEGIPQIARKTVFYKGKAIEEMDFARILQLKPEVVLVDELAHSNVPGSQHQKRWEDVVALLQAGISVISAVNIQHLESINSEIEQITGIPITERIPDRILGLADEMVNIDLTVDELLKRLKEGKIYAAGKIDQALNHFFKIETILQLREMSLKEVAHHVERKLAIEIPAPIKFRKERFLACISSNPESAKIVIRKTARLASYYQSEWLAIYVQTDRENSESIRLDKQRHLIHNLQLASSLGARVIKVKNNRLVETLLETMDKEAITTVCMGKPHLSLYQLLLKTNLFHQLLRALDKRDTDLIILS